MKPYIKIIILTFLLSVCINHSKAQNHSGMTVGITSGYTGSNMLSATGFSYGNYLTIKLNRFFELNAEFRTDILEHKSEFREMQKSNISIASEFKFVPFKTSSEHIFAIGAGPIFQYANIISEDQYPRCGNTYYINLITNEDNETYLPGFSVLTEYKYQGLDKFVLGVSAKVYTTKKSDGEWYLLINLGYKL
ncbi:MAG: hypothetical protein U9N85_05890 [Bacteroidota bacterium]|nr:hypothetical protein [Bacteroidota bacterium]